MSVLMYDGINSLAAGIARQFPGAAKVAYYIDGRYAWSPAEVGLFPGADHVRIAVRPTTNAGDVLDVEPGDATVSQLLGWIEMRKAAGLFRPTGYCSLDTVAAARRATKSLVLGVDYDLWVAHYTGSPHQAYPGCAATQYESTDRWDASLVHDTDWPHRTPAPPKPAPQPHPTTPTLEEIVAQVPVVKRGDTGQPVKNVQGLLNARGAALAIDGQFGLKTEAALVAAQKRLGVADDGVCGAITMKALLTHG